MTAEEAREWLRGERSLCDMIPTPPFESWQLRISQADAAMIQQAYYVLKAHKEGLLKEDE